MQSQSAGASGADKDKLKQAIHGALEAEIVITLIKTSNVSVE